MTSRPTLALVSILVGITWSGAAFSGLINFEAVYVIDDKTTFDPSATVIISDPDFGNTNIGDRFIVDFTLDTSAIDSDNTVTTLPNPTLVQGDTRGGNFGSVLQSLTITAAPGNVGIFDPSGIGFNATTASQTSDTQGVYQLASGNPGASANNERVRLVAATDPTPPSLGGSLTDVFLNFLNRADFAVNNPFDYLDDDSATTSPFTFDDLFGGSTCLLCDARDLALLTDDFADSVNPLGENDRPLNLLFGQALVIPGVGPEFEENIYAYGAFESLRVVQQVPIAGTLPLLLGPLCALFVFARNRRAQGNAA